MALFTNISGCVSFFGKMSRLTLYVKIKLYHMIIHVFGDLAPRGGSYLSYSKTMASKTLSLFTFSQKMR